MPTEMKKKPSSRPSNGSISACNSWRYSLPDSSTPARKAPSDMDSPAALASAAAPTTVSRARVVNISGVRAPPMARNAGRMRNRPPIRMATIAPPPRATSSQGTWSGTSAPPSSGTRATSGIKARSWNSSTAKASRPAGVPSRSRSASIGSTMAVEDMARPVPSTAAPAHAMPAVWASAASTAAHTATWAVPRPNTARRMTHRRCGRSSSPIRNSSMTTPSSDTWAMSLRSVTRRSPDGPMATPASR